LWLRPPERTAASLQAWETVTGNKKAVRPEDLTASTMKLGSELV
jgi:hypothetical protein